jgi:hypothetical protein
VSAARAPSGAVRANVSQEVKPSRGDGQLSFQDMYNMVSAEQDAWLVRERYRRATADTLAGSQREEWIESAQRCAWRAAGFGKLMRLIVHCADPVIKQRLAEIARQEIERDAS